MKKLLDLTNEALLTGRARSKFDDGAIWNTAQGLNPFIEDDEYRGLLAIGGNPTDLTSSTVVDIPMAHAVDQRGSTNNMYILGSGGNFYNVAVGNGVTNLRSGANVIGNPANGMLIMQPAGGAATLYYFRTTRIGSWDLSNTYPTGWDDVAFNPGTTTVHRPTHRFDRIGYFGNKNYVGYLYDNAGTIAMQAQALSLNPLEVCTAITDDGRYVVVGASQPTTESYGSNSHCRVLFWDGGTNEVVWQTRVDNESSIRALYSEGGTIYIIGSRGVYTTALGASDATTLYRFDSDEAIPYDGINYGHPECVASLNDGIIFGSLATAISKPLPNKSRIIYNPLQGFTGDISMYATDFLSGKIYVGTRSSKLYYYDLAGIGTSSTPIVTRNIHLGDKYHLNRLEVNLPNGIGAADTITVVVQGDDGAQSQTHTIDRATWGNVYTVQIPLTNITTTHVRLSLTLSAGVPTIHSMALYGTKAPF